MKGIVVTSDLQVSVRDFSDPLFKSVGAVVGGYIEHVKPIALKEPYCIIINEEGLLLGLPINPVGCFFYGSHEHGCPIVGDIVLMKDGFRDDEPDIVGLDHDEIRLLLEDITALAGELKGAI